MLPDKNAGKWSWRYWNVDENGVYEDEVIIYSPDSYNSGIDEYYVVVKFRLESKDWWICQFQDSKIPEQDVQYLRINNYKHQLREAMTTCYALNKMLGAC